MTFNVFSFFFLSIPICICSSLLIHYLVFFILFFYSFTPLSSFFIYTYSCSYYSLFYFYVYFFYSLYLFLYQALFWFFILFFFIPFSFLQSYIFIFIYPYSCSFSSRFLFLLFFMCIFYFIFLFCFCSPTFLIFTTSISHSSLFYLKLHLSLASYPPLSLTPHFIHHYCLPSPSSSFISHSFHSPFHHFS